MVRNGNQPAILAVAQNAQQQTVMEQIVVVGSTSGAIVTYERPTASRIHAQKARFTLSAFRRRSKNQMMHRRSGVSALSIRFGVCLAVALIAASGPALNLLQGRGVWLGAVACIIVLFHALAVRRCAISPPIALETFGLLYTSLGLTIQYNSHFGTEAGAPYIQRVAVFALVFAFWWWLGRKMYSSYLKKQTARVHSLSGSPMPEQR